MLQRNYSDKLHIKIYNSMIDDKSDIKLTPSELYIYALLCINATSDDDRMMPTSVDMINYMSPFRFATKDNNNKNHIKKALTELMRKDYLLIVDDGIQIDDIKNNTFLTLEINHEALDNKYEPLYYNEFRFLSNPDEVFIYIISKRFTAFSEGFKASYNRWGRLLNVSDKTASNKLNDAEKNGVIEVIRGKYEEINRQEINLYCHVDLMGLKDFDDDAQEEVMQPKVKKLAIGEKKISPEEEARRAFG